MPALARVLREPLTHFLIIGVAVFTAFELTADRSSSQRQDAILITEAHKARLIAEFEAVWRRSPTEDETERLIEDFVREEIYVREALALGLDQNDTVIRRRLRQKMEFLGNSVVESLDPKEEELYAFFAEKAADYIVGGSVAFEQVFLGERPDIAKIEAARAMLSSGGDPVSAGDRTLLPSAMRLSDESMVDGVFGRGFFAALEALPPNEWQGPVESGFGAHLVRVLVRHEPRMPEFEAVREKVLEAWRRHKSAELNELSFARLRERYEVIRGDRSTP